MTDRSSCRRRLAEAVTLALATMSYGAVVAAAPKASPAVATDTSLLCAAPLLGKADAGQGLVLRYGFGGWKLVESGQQAEPSCMLKSTTANLNLLFEGNGLNALLLESAPRFVYPSGTGGLPGKRLELVSTEPVLCESYYGATLPDLLALSITDPNGRVQNVRGVQGISYTLPAAGDGSTGRFRPVSAQASFGPYVQCYGVPYSTLSQGAPDVPAPDMALSGTIFGSGFEVAPPPSQRADLRIEILDGSDGFLVRNLQAIINSPFSYSIRIRNAGPVAANGLRVKEFLVDSDAPNPLLAPSVEAQGWTCSERAAGVLQSQPGTDCGTGSGVLAVGEAGFSLAPGASRTYALTRNVPTVFDGQTNAEDGDRSVLAAAVFFDPADSTGQGDVSSAENIASAVFQLTENPGPSIACVADAGNATPYDSGSLPSPINVNEDAAALLFSCALSDPDGVASFVAASSNGGLVPQAGLLGARSGDTWPLTISFTPDLFGSSTLTLTATDTLGATRQLATVVNVTEINDPPSFDIAGVDTSVPLDEVIERRVARIGLRASGGLPQLFDQDNVEIDLFNLPAGNNLIVQRDPNCGSGGACSIRIPDFFRFVDAGPGQEATTQQVSVQATDCAPGISASLFFTDARSGAALPTPHSTAGSTRPSGSHFDLVFTYDKAQVGSLNANCNFRFTDTASPPETTIDTPSRAVIFEGFAGS